MDERKITDKKSFSCECTASAFVSHDTVSLEFTWHGPTPRAGQFFLIKPERSGVFLGRPICAAGWKENNSSTSANASASWILRFLITRRGKGSTELTEIKTGDKAFLTGPLGNFWPCDSAPEGKFALVGGGVGIAPLLSLAHNLTGKPFDFYAGFGTGSFGLENIEAEKLTIATEDGSQGIKGRILDFFSPVGYSAVFACGPDSMIKALAEVSKKNNVTCYVSTGKLMACGVGACRGCKIQTVRGSLCCCSDGPIFDTRELCFDD